jgi:hypothetical protein
MYWAMEATFECDTWADTLCCVRVPAAVAESGVGSRGAGTAPPALGCELVGSGPWRLTFVINRFSSRKMYPTRR